MSGPAVSVIIGNYNYGRFLAEAIDSALGQDYPRTEVVVVDDGSTDHSREVIAGYGDRIVPVLKENGGMGSTYNAGLPRSRGEVILFLDADDLLLPSAAAEAVKALSDSTVVKAHWPLVEVDETGRRTGAFVPRQPLAEGDFREATLAAGPDCYLSPPTSGNAWSRRFLEAVLPLPESEYRQHADAYLVTLAPLFGTVRRVAAPQALYRIHGGNDYASRPTHEKNRRNLEIFDRRCAVLATRLARQGVSVDPETWKARNPYYTWMRRLADATEDLSRTIPPGCSVILADEDQWADRWGGSGLLEGRRVIPFLERDGQYWGPPPDDAVAVAELERLRRSGADFFAVGWPAFWWLEHYAGLHRQLRAHFPCVLENDRLIVFDLRCKQR
jgi:glycosyltransferase involved in cell wall biosynthesis